MEKETERAVQEEAAILSTRRLTIRRFEQDEWPLLLAYLQDDGIAEAFPEGIYTEQRLREMTADRDLYALIAKEDGRLIGHAALHPGAHPAGAAFALGVISSGRRLGYGEEAARALLRYVFAEQGLHRVTVSCPPENLALRALLEKLGMRMEAFFRRSVPTVDGEWRDECVYAMLADEWRVQESLLQLGLRESEATAPTVGTANGSGEAGEEFVGETVEKAALNGTAVVTSEEIPVRVAGASDAEFAWAEEENVRLGEATSEFVGLEPVLDETDREAFDDIAALALAGSELAEVEETAAMAEAWRSDTELPDDVSAYYGGQEVPENALEAEAETFASGSGDDAPPLAEAAEPADLPNADLSAPVVLPEDSDIPQVTLALGEAGGGRPFAPILPASLSPEALRHEAHSPSDDPGLPEGLIEQRIDGVPFVLRRPHDFNWLAPFGRVFRVWDRQDSGNLAFGLEIEDQKVFIKYAGAFTAEYDGHPVEAVRRLREAAGVYEVLRHPALVRVLDHFETTDGYAVLYEWAEGKLLRPGAEQGAADAVISRFRRLPIEERIEAMDTILDFHAYVEALNYVAIDFYDGSLIYDFEAKRMTICDIDFYRPQPYTNDMGRMWGSSRFMSPEEHEFGATIDSRTNVYNMGAMAFCLLGGERDRSRELWEAGDELYEVALRAVSPERAKRWESVDALLEAWEAAQSSST